MLEPKPKPLCTTKLIVALFLAPFLLACNVEHTRPQQEPAEGEMTYFSLTRAAETEKPTINHRDDSEDYVKEVRLILVDPQDQSVVLNELLAFPNNNVGQNGAGYSHWSVPQKVKAGTYMLYCIANETSHPGVTEKLKKEALTHGSKIMELISDFDPSFKPNKNEGKGLLMTASKEVTLEAGKDYLNPNRIKVDLARCVAKLDLTFNCPPGSEAEKLGLYVSSLTVGKMPSQCYLFSRADKPYAGTLEKEHNYTNVFPLPTPVTDTITRYMPEYKNSTTPIELKITIKQANTAVERTRTIKLGVPLKEDGSPAQSSSNSEFLRNHRHNYVFTLKDWSDIAVQFEVGDWEADNSWTYVGQYFNLSVSNKEMPVGKAVTLTLYTSQPTESLPSAHEVVLKPLNGATINGSTEPVRFKETAYGAFATYTLIRKADTSKALEVIYMGAEELTLPL